MQVLLVLVVWVHNGVLHTWVPSFKESDGTRYGRIEISAIGGGGRDNLTCRTVGRS